jgi:hypothetical protein
MKYACLLLLAFASFPRFILKTFAMYDFNKFKTYCTLKNGVRIGMFIFAIFHISSIAIHSTISAYYSYNKFYDKPTDSKIIKKMSKLSGTDLYKTYGKISATQCGYGFFAPNVRASSQLVIQGCGKEITPEFASHEGRLRYEGFIGDMINDLDTDELKKDETKIEEVLNKYQKLLLKNISIKMIKENKMNCGLYMVRYNVLDFPTRAETLESGKSDLRILPAKSFLIAKSN